MHYGLFFQLWVISIFSVARRAGFLSLVVMGFSTAISIRIIILGSVFFKRISVGTLVSFLQPMLLFK
ncbi:MAG: hypothetical protein CM1200mP13_12260 [Candidatus Pelagibacterales bacterium]|nr:MAG: hypothetical protein CM1200mP13_12260 [Pelagibacterales bacterium]